MEPSQPLSIKENTKVVEESIREVQTNLREYKNLVETARADIVAMENKSSLATEDTPKSIIPQIEELLGDLRQEVQHQKDTNEHIQRQITALKKEESVVQQHIVASNTRCQILEQQIGFT